MSIEATVESSYGERLLLWHTDGIPGGGQIDSFLNVLVNYCFEDKNDIRSQEVDHWFSKIEAITKQSICELTKPLRTGFYYGSWEYTEKEYDRFLSHARDMPLSEDDFKQTLQHVAKTWVDAEEMLNMVNTLIDLFEKAELEATWWCFSNETLADFLALKEAVEIVNRGPTCKLRIQFT